MSDASPKKNKNEPTKAPSEFVVGLVTFVVFIIFMTAWMFFGSSS